MSYSGNASANGDVLNEATVNDAFKQWHTYCSSCATKLAANGQDLLAMTREPSVNTKQNKLSHALHLAIEDRRGSSGKCEAGLYGRATAMS